MGRPLLCTITVYQVTQTLRLIWSLPHHSHVSLTHKFAGLSGTLNMVYSRSKKLLEAAMHSWDPRALVSLWDKDPEGHSEEQLYF